MRIELTEQSGLEVNRLSAADMTPPWRPGIWREGSG